VTVSVLQRGNNLWSQNPADKYTCKLSFNEESVLCPYPSKYNTASNDLTLHVQGKDLGFQVSSIILLISVKLRMSLQVFSIR